MQENYLAEERRKEKHREDEFAARMKKIQDKMDRMADTVVRNEKEKIIAEERRLLQLTMEREQKIAEEEK